jgi:FkbM family methyltransferase
MSRGPKHIARDLCAAIVSRVLLRYCPSFVNYIYDGLPHRWLVYLLGHSFFGRPKSSFPWRITLRNGRQLHVMVDPKDGFSLGYAFDYKVHDIGLKRSQEFFLNRCDDRALYLDIGANIGVSSIYALSAGCQCWLFEPNTTLHEVGKGLYAHNHFTRARWEPVALSDTSGEAKFYVSRSSFLSSFDRQNAEREGDAVEIVVPMRSLDSYLEELQATADELIVKIDVEGHEMQVLAGARHVMSHYRPAVMIELLKQREARCKAWDWFEAMSYICLGIFDEPVLRLCPLQSVDELVSFGEINFIFMPADHRLRAEFEANVCQR